MVRVPSTLRISLSIMLLKLFFNCVLFFYIFRFFSLLFLSHFGVVFNSLKCIIYQILILNKDKSEIKTQAKNTKKQSRICINLYCQSDNDQNLRCSEERTNSNDGFGGRCKDQKTRLRIQKIHY